MQTPNPGSPEARAAGCKCPALDNAHGRGRKTARITDLMGDTNE